MTSPRALPDGAADLDGDAAAGSAATGNRRWWVIGVIGCTLLAGVATWLALANTVGQVTWTVTGYRVSDTSTVVDFDVHRPADKVVTCAVTALDEGFGTVGSTSVTVPASTDRSVHQRVTIRTTTRAVTGTVSTCTFAP